MFAFKAWVLQRKRLLSDILHPVSAYKPKQTLQNANLLSTSTSLLWTGEDTSKALIAGKIHNIRIAIKRLDGIVVPKGEVFSFWKQVGKLTKRCGFVVGRELREECIIPNVGGGICQLTNAIYDAAVKAGLEIIERHPHSQVIKGSLAECGRDATVFWNYLDLRLRFSCAWQICVKMDEKSLTVQIFADAPSEALDTTTSKSTPDALGDCTQCGRIDCYLHTGDIPLHDQITHLATDEEWVEFAEWRGAEAEGRLISTFKNPPIDTRIANFTSKLLRRYHMLLGDLELKRSKISPKSVKNFYNWRKHPLPVAQNARYIYIAKHFAKKLNDSDMHLVIPQNLLIWLYLEGELAGRKYDVLMTSLPICEIEKRLDEEWQRHGESDYGKEIPTSGDFRAPKWLVEAENEALSGASKLITPHAQILKFASSRDVPLEWQLPNPVKNIPNNDGHFRILLAGASLARKGIFELRIALNNILKDLKNSFDFELLLPPSAKESDNFWSGIKTRDVRSMREGVALCDIAVLPAVVEHCPRGLLLAITSNKPVIASQACGLTPNLAWKSADRWQELEEEIRAAYLAKADVTLK
jgi:hypothetical protein